MKMMVQLNRNEISQLQYPIVVEAWKKRIEGIKNRTAWYSTFSEAEQQLAEKSHVLFRKWYLLQGTPETFTVSPETYMWLTNKFIPFMARL